MTARPTMQPATSMIPSSVPSFSGLVASFDITKAVTSQLTDAEISTIEAEVISSFDVSDGEVDTTGNQLFTK